MFEGYPGLIVTIALVITMTFLFLTCLNDYQKDPDKLSQRFTVALVGVSTLMLTTSMLSALVRLSL